MVKVYAPDYSHKSASMYRCLYLKVIAMTADQARGGGPYERQSVVGREREKNRARIYLTKDSIDLRKVCELAEIEVEDVLERYRGEFL